MQQFYINIDDQQVGPFTLEELKEKRISSGTMVWHESLIDWAEAGKVQALHGMFATPPPIKKAKYQKEYYNYKPVKIRALSILSIIFSVIFLIWFMIFSASGAIDKGEFAVVGVFFALWSLSFAIVATVKSN